LIEQLRRAGIYAAGGADHGDLKAILIRESQDVDRAIALLKQMGIDAERG
jgi:hypothetical protein